MHGTVGSNGNISGGCVDNGYLVYFYSPNFPRMADEASFEEYIEEEIERQLTDEEIWKALEEKGYRYIERKAEDLVDWREIIFQMARDYRLHNHDDDFYLKVRTTNGLDFNNEWYYPNGRTGYEQYYIDMEGFWRQLYCPPKLFNELYANGSWTNKTANGQYYYNTGEIKADSDKAIYFSKSEGILYNITNYTTELQNGETWYEHWKQNQDVNDGWNYEIINSPATLNFWFDFLDANEETDLIKYSVPAIGDRAKSVNDSMVKAIYFRETPTAIFTDNIQTADKKSGYTYLQYKSENSQYFNISSQGKSAYDVMLEYINLYLYCIESISITSIPVYNLQPNTRIMVNDQDSKINGEYLVNRITIPLNYNGTMSVSAVKSAEIIY